jgi:hypothetical protein
VLLATTNVASTDIFGLNGLLSFSIHPIVRTYVGNVGDRFFVGAKVSCQPGVFCAIVDGSASTDGPNWRITAFLGQGDIERLSANAVFQLNSDDFALRAISLDCNGNGAADQCDIAGGTSIDANGNGAPDECESFCPADIAPAAGDHVVDVSDLVGLISAWGECPKGPCPADIVPIGIGNGMVDIDDLLEVLTTWGACP